ncbi:lipase/esterase [Sphingobium indicum BiD32]|uniref:Lipase/esterase n=1 Tax=Sphingobium indicum BiD32 TaxID=1301087 RepID=N1MJK1_9SPHN|nr:lipase/esterase [Sphingobium indicum BiD32]
MARPIDIVIEKVRRTYGAWRRNTPIEAMREDWDNLFWSDATGVVGEPVMAGGVDAMWIVAPGATRERVFLYLHGGGYRVGSIRSHFDLIARISAASGAAGFAINYRLAPEHPFPAAIEDVLTTCEWLVGQGVSLDHVALAGDSAGGNLALAGTLKLRAKGGATPAALVLLSPWTDLELRGKSYETRADSDPIHQRAMLAATAAGYLGGADPADPLASPLNAAFAGFPPMLIQVGDRETVLDDSRNLAAKAEAAGVSVQLEVWDEMIHVFQQFPDELDEAREAIAHIGAFLRERLL